MMVIWKFGKTTPKVEEKEKAKKFEVTLGLLLNSEKLKKNRQRS